MIKKILLALLALLLSVTAVVLYRTFAATSKQIPAKAALLPPLPEGAVARLQKAIQCPTISFGDTMQWKAEPFEALRAHLEASYPLVHQKMTREVVSGYSYLYAWQGKNPQLAPYVFMAHQDVVPVEEKTLNLWTAKPFDGLVRNDTIYGRGAIDNKCNLISIFEAAERLLGQGFQPERTLYFVFGHDEEIGGRKGAIPIAKLLESRGVKADLLIDEGGIVTEKRLPEVGRPVALIATAEKGYLSLSFSVTKKGGHSSMPDPETAVDILMRGLMKLHDNPFPPRFVTATEGFLRYVGPEMPFGQRMAFANRWLFERLIVKAMDASPSSRAMLRTTSVTTILEAGIKDNVVPSVATAIANFRLLPGDSVEAVVQKVKEIIGDDRVEVMPKGKVYNEASSAPEADGLGFQEVAKIARQTYDNVVVSPFLLIGATDSRHFGKVSDHIVKFSPVVDPIGFHTYDEQVSINSFQHSIWFFEQLMRE